MDGDVVLDQAVSPITPSNDTNSDKITVLILILRKHNHLIPLRESDRLRFVGVDDHAVRLGCMIITVISSYLFYKQDTFSSIKDLARYFVNGSE